MLSGIRDELLSLNQEYTESFKNKDIDKTQTSLALSMINKIQAFLDFLYRDNNQLFNALKEEAEEVKTKDSLLEIEYNKNVIVELSELYVDFCLATNYPHRGNVFNSMFYGDVL